MSHAGQPDELLEVLGDELRAVIENAPRLGLRKLLTGSLQDDIHVFLGHGLAQFPVYDEAAAAVQDAAQVVERTVQIDVGDIDMPVLMRYQGLQEALALTAAFGVPAFHQTGGAQHAVDAAGAEGNDILVKHHKGQATVAFQGIVQVKLDDCLLLPVFEPEVTGDQAIVFIDFAIAALPFVVLTGSYAQPLDESRYGDAALLRPVTDEVDNGITGIMGNPGRG